MASKSWHRITPRCQHRFLSHNSHHITCTTCWLDPATVLFRYESYLPVPYPRMVHIAYPRLFSKPFLFNPTRADSLFYLAHWSITGFCNAYCVSDLSDAGHRVGNVALLHLILLFASPRICLTSQLLGLTLSSSYRLHRALGSMAVSQTLFHSVVLMKQISLTTPVGASTSTVSLSLTVLNLGD